MADFVTTHDGPVLVASHDRAFLDLVTTSVVELDLPQQRIGYYTGNYSDFVAGRELARRQAREAFEEYAGARDHLVAQARQRADWAAKGHRDAGPRTGAGQAPAREVPGPGRPAGREVRAAEEGGRTGSTRSTSRARSGSCATPSRPGRRPPRSSRPWTGPRWSAGSSGSVRST